MEKEVLERETVKEPDVRLLMRELEQAQVDATQYIDRIERCRHWWHCIWKDQTYDGRKHAQGEEEVVLPWEGACFSLDTEILTDHGWRMIGDIKKGERVYSRSEDGTAQYRSVSETIRTTCSMAVELKGKSIDLTVTPNHNMVVLHRPGRRSSRRSFEQLFVPAIDLVQKYCCAWIPLTSKWIGESPETICGMSAKSYVRLLGWYISEGSTNNGGSIGIAQTSKSKCSILERDLSDAGISWNYSGNTYWLRSRTVSADFRNQVIRMGGAKEKCIPNEVLFLNSYLLTELLDALICGDGHIKRNGHRLYYTSSKRLADQIQILCQHIGKRASISVRLPRLGGIIRGRRITGIHPQYVVHINSKSVIQTNKLFADLIELPIAQEFACVDVPPCHTLYVRRNGKAVWCGNSDSRLRIVDTIIDQHVSLAKAAFWGSKLNVKSTRPLVYGRMANVAQKVLEWHVYTQQRRELLRELWHYFVWKYGFGLAFMWIEWEQQRNKTYETITLDDLIKASQSLGLPELVDLGDEESSDAAVQFVQSLSPIITTDEARKVVSELKNQGISEFPVVNLTVNKPKWSARIPCVDILVPSETSEIQTARFVNLRELVNEWELVDRIETDGYDPDFVEEALKHKGEFSEWMAQPGWRYNSQGSERDMVELQHFIYRVTDDGNPCIYRTIFNQATAGKHADLVAKHGAFEYRHPFYPVVAGRRTYDFKPMLTSVGIAEEAYTDELDIKQQQDGLNDRTELINSPPMIVPLLRAQGIKSTYGPRAMMSSIRPQDVNYPPLPPSDNTPVQVIQMVYQRLAERYWCTDPQMKIIRLQEIAQDVHTEIELMLEQTLKLAQQFDTSEIVNRVAGDPKGQWNATVEDMAGDYEISVTYDPRLSDMNYVKEKVGLYTQVLASAQSGGAKMNKIEQRLLNIVDPDAEDIFEEDMGDVTGKEVDEEDAAAVSILSGIEPRFPQHGNHQLRMQRLVSQTIQSKNPEVQQKIMQSKQIQTLLKNRIKNFQNQIQQFKVNPQIGRTVTTSAQNPQQPAEMTAQ